MALTANRKKHLNKYNNKKIKIIQTWNFMNKLVWSDFVFIDLARASLAKAAATLREQRSGNLKKGEV